MDLWDRSEEVLTNTLLKTDLEKETNDGTILEEELVGFCFHEAYHAGQLGILRHIIGLGGAIR
jgi:hypothetical protein